jgi:hypothetical protein
MLKSLSMSLILRGILARVVGILALAPLPAKRLRLTRVLPPDASIFSQPAIVAYRSRHRRRSDAGDADYRKRWLSQSSASWAISCQPWSIVRECPRSANSRKSVIAGDLW